MAIALSTKRKIGFVQGTIPKPEEDPAKVEQWEACNNLVISSIMNSVSESINKSVLYIRLARQIWKHLESRFNPANGSRKYKLNKDVYAMKQNKIPISEYYTKMRGIWEELNSMSELLILTVLTDEIATFLNALSK